MTVSFIRSACTPRCSWWRPMSEDYVVSVSYRKRLLGITIYDYSSFSFSLQGSPQWIRIIMYDDGYYCWGFFFLTKLHNSWCVSQVSFIFLDCELYKRCNLKKRCSSILQLEPAFVFNWFFFFLIKSLRKLFVSRKQPSLAFNSTKRGLVRNWSIRHWCYWYSSSSPLWCWKSNFSLCVFSIKKFPNKMLQHIMCGGWSLRRLLSMLGDWVLVALLFALPLERNNIHVLESLNSPFTL